MISHSLESMMNWESNTMTSEPTQLALLSVISSEPLNLLVL